MRLGDLNDETDCDGAESKHAENIALTEIFGGVCERDGVHCCDEIDGNSADLCSCGCVPDALEDSWLEAGNGVCVFYSAEVHENGGPDLPIPEVFVYALGRKLVVGYRSPIILQTGEEKCLLLWVEERTVFWERDDKEVRYDADRDCNATFDYEDPNAELGPPESR